MVRKFSFALALALLLISVSISLVLAADPIARVQFTADAPCSVNVSVPFYTNPAGQAASIDLQTASPNDTIDTMPGTSLAYGYDTSVTCNGVTYQFLSVSAQPPGNLSVSGIDGSLTVITGHYSIDATPPTLHLPANLIVEATSAAGAVVTFTATADDINPAHPLVICNPAPGNIFVLGLTTVNCSATDANGTTANGSFTVTVQDITPPAINVPANITTPQTSSTGAVVNYSASASDLVDGSIVPTCVPASGSTFTVGTAVVTCTATDTHNNTGSASFNVTVTADQTAPVLTLPSDITVDTTNNPGTIVNFTAIAFDAIDGSVPVTCVPASGSLFPIGQTLVNCSATDLHGNTATGSFNVIVNLIVDNVPPVLTLPGDMTVPAMDASGAVVSYTVSANDAIDGLVPVTCSPASGSMFPVGMTIVNCSASDLHGNTANGSFTVSIQYLASCKGVPAHQILQPINPDGSSVFKQGSTVPAKFRVCGADGNAINTPDLITDFRLVRVIGDGTMPDVIDSTSAHDAFRSGAQQWIFDINTKNLSAGSTYVFQIALNDGSTIQFQFALK